MSTVMRLVWIYFSATRLMSVLAMLGIAFVLAGVGGYLMLPLTGLGRNTTSSSEWVIYNFVLGLPWLGFVLLMSASALMPGIVEKFLTGRRIWILPHGRLRLLISMLVPGVLLAALTAIAATAAFLSFMVEGGPGRIFYRTLLMAFVDIGLIYAAIWFVSKTSGIWRLAGTLWIVTSILIPMRYFGGIPPVSLLELLGLACWAAFGVIVLSGGRARHALAAIRERIGARLQFVGGGSAYTAGREADLLLGTANPWPVALGQVVPIAAIALFVPDSRIWIVFLMIFSVISGAITSQGALRSRCLWLRYPMTRTEIGACAERAFWRYNARSLVVLLAMCLGLAAWYEFPVGLTLMSCLLLVLGCAVSTYLGLMITRGLGWYESILCILTMCILMFAALSIMTFNLEVAARAGVLLAGMIVAYRYLARARWSHLDWMRAR